MYAIPLEKIYDKITRATSMPQSEIRERVRAKLQSLSGLISEEGAAHIIANELGVKLFEAPGLVKISDLLAGMRGIDVQGKVVRKYERRQFTTKDGREGSVANILLGDETGVTRIVFWNTKTVHFDEAQEGDILKISNATVKDNNGRAEVHVNDASVVMRNPAGITLTVTVRTQSDPLIAPRKYIQDLQDTDQNVALLGAIVQVFDLRYFEVCPQCNKRARATAGGFECPTHGITTPNMNYVLSLILDDGTGTIRVTCWREQTQQLTKHAHEEIILMQQTPSAFEDTKIGLLGTIVKITGKVQKNQTFDRIEFVASHIDPNPNPEQELKTLMESKLAPKAPVPDLKSGASTPIQAGASSIPLEKNSASKEYFEEDV
jgi:hypothetical protein